MHFTDSYQIYQVLDHHVVGKKYTHTTESYNSYSSPTCPDSQGTRRQ
ncbi:hypothetical protein IC006_0571 [Sulfuracidifex tepidarius]|uniref:Uncharacterized protein n=1 Tax=Sulfuracidifex tepidarius TaxID=1294262 RepID=A0A510DT17_9CREN|nr:hypothetical protein IC006_0571 [Sulfuracidifex tepidarius]